MITTTDDTTNNTNNNEDDNGNPSVVIKKEPVTPLLKKYNTEELNKFVEDYREDVNGSAEKLIEAFSPITKKYIRLCNVGIWDARDEDVISFLAMLGNSDPQTVANMLVYALKAYEPADIEQEIILALLTTARKYTNISKNFKFVFKRQLKNLLKDPLVYMSGVGPAQLYPDIEEYVSAQDDETELNSAWINGYTVKGKGLDIITPVQRALLKLIYVDGKSQAVAAKVLGYGTITTLQRDLSKAIAILSRFYRTDLKDAKEYTDTNNGTSTRRSSRSPSN